MTVLSNSLTVSDGGLGISAAGQRPVVVAGCCSSGAVAAPTTVDTLDGLTSTFGYGPAVRDAVASDTGIARHAVHSALAGVAAQPSTIRAVDAAARRYGARTPQAAMLDGLRGAA